MSAAHRRSSKASGVLSSVFSALAAVLAACGRLLARLAAAAFAQLRKPKVARIAVPCVLAVVVIGGVGVSAMNSAASKMGEGPQLPAYISEDMVDAALRMQREYGHPAGCTIAQIIQESGYEGGLSALAAEDNNLFGMKWIASFEGKPGVVGPANWDTNEEYDGETVQINDAFIEFTDPVACIEFRSSVFLQAERYAQNPLIQEAIAQRSSELMARGLADAGWATDSSYAESLIALMDQYDLYRFDS